jgi:hypothetical protein
MRKMTMKPRRTAMEVVFETWIPAHRTQMVAMQDLPRVYRDATEELSPSFTWNDCGDEVLIVTLGDDYSTVTMLNKGTFYNLAISDSDEPAEILVSGDVTTWPEGQILPREMGLEVLLRAEDFQSVVRDYTWKEQ